jgi:4-amino-4-deoxy-L-arabinose transferase-like glycosyltransferase
VKTLPTWAALALITAFALAARLVALPASTERNMDPDSAHLLNIARCFERGQGYSNPAGWPAWMRPERLPMPETFKEPGYSWAIARLAPLAGGEFRAGLLLSMVAGLLLPLALYALARQLNCGRGTALLGTLLVAANPLAIGMSVRVMVDSIFPLLLTAAFAAAAWRPRDPARQRMALADLAAGALTGLAFLVRAQTLVALPALALLLCARRPLARGIGSFSVALGAAILTASPLLLRNLRLFGIPLYSDVTAYGIWPYVDTIAFSHGLDHPPAPLGFALGHVPQVLRHMAESAMRFGVYALPNDIAGNPAWLVALFAGLVLAAARWREFSFAWVYLGLTLAMVFAVLWDSRYFASTIPLWALFTALGSEWLARAIAPLRLAGRVRGAHLLAGALVILIGVQAAIARRTLTGLRQPEIEAARALAPVLRERLGPDEAAMVITTSFYSWFSDRPTVHLVIAGEPEFLATVRRLKVRLAVLPTSRLAQLAARYPGGRLPSMLVPERSDPALDVTLFSVREPAGAAP